MTRPRTQHEIGDLHWRMERAQAETKPCRGCGAEIGAHCRNPSTGAELQKLPAHWQRIKDAREEEISVTTQYYLHRDGEPCAACGRDTVDPEIHIGHSAGNWVFLWCGWRDGNSPAGRPLDTPARWFDYLAEAVERGGVIKDEYGGAITLDSFARFVASKRVDHRPGGAHRHSDLPNTRIVHVDGDDFAFYG